MIVTRVLGCSRPGPTLSLDLRPARSACILQLKPRMKELQIDEKASFLHECEALRTALFLSLPLLD